MTTPMSLSLDADQRNNMVEPVLTVSLARQVALDKALPEGESLHGLLEAGRLEAMTSELGFLVSSHPGRNRGIFAGLDRLLDDAQRDNIGWLIFQSPTAPPDTDRIDPMLVLSTGHLPEVEVSDDEADSIGAAIQQKRVAGFHSQFNVVLSASEVVPEQYPVLADILDRAHFSQFAFVMFDRDGDYLDDLSRYDW